MARSARSKVIALLAGALFLWVAVVSAAHTHPRASGAVSVKSECQLCSLAQARIDVSTVAPILFGLAAVGSLVSSPAAVAPTLLASSLPSPRAPPFR